MLRNRWGDYDQKPCSANNWNHGPIARREQLKIYDPETYELVRSAFNLSAGQDWRYRGGPVRTSKQ